MVFGFGPNAAMPIFRKQLAEAPHQGEIVVVGAEQRALAADRQRFAGAVEHLCAVHSSRTASSAIFAFCAASIIIRSVYQTARHFSNGLHAATATAGAAVMIGWRILAETARQPRSDGGAAINPDHGAEGAGYQAEDPEAMRQSDRKAGQSAHDQAGPERLWLLAARNGAKLVDDEFPDCEDSENADRPRLCP